MNYDKIILELMSRVQNLEEQMTEMKNEFSKKHEKSNDIIEDTNSVQIVFTRSQARDRVIEIIKNKFQNYLVEKATRKEGSGIKITMSALNPEKAVFIKFFHSKTYEDNTGSFEHAWHTVDLVEISGTPCDYYLFSVVDKNGDWNFFLYEPNELYAYKDENRTGASKLLHLYFAIKDEKAFEVREKTIDVSDHLNNWNVLEQSAF